MRDPIQSHAALEDWSQILLWCLLMGLAAMLFWVAALFFAGDLAYAVHSRVVPITREQFNIVHYSGHNFPGLQPIKIGYLKILQFVIHILPNAEHHFLTNASNAV